MAFKPQRIKIPVTQSFGPGYRVQSVMLTLLASVYDPSMARYYCLAYNGATFETFIVSYPPKSEEYYIIRQGPRKDMLNEYLRIVIEAHAFDPVAFPWTVE